MASSARIVRAAWVCLAARNHLQGRALYSFDGISRCLPRVAVAARRAERKDPCLCLISKLPPIPSNQTFREKVRGHGKYDLMPEPFAHCGFDCRAARSFTISRTSWLGSIGKASNVDVTGCDRSPRLGKLTTTARPWLWQPSFLSPTTAAAKSAGMWKRGLAFTRERSVTPAVY